MSERDNESIFRPDEDRIPTYVDLIVETANPSGLDTVLHSFGATMQWSPDTEDGYHKTEEGYYRARCYGDPGYVKWAIENQGYARVIREEEVT